MNGTFSVLMDAPGTVELEQVSLFPQETFNGRRNGLRKDLVQLLKDLKPGVLRFPGGCVAEGDSFERWFDWKRTVGALERRETIWNIWGYWQSFGLGYYEYFCLAEDIGAEPLPICLAGITCQFRGPKLAPLESMDYFAQSICDLVDFANADPKKNKWGALRAEMGHPKPFNLKMVGVGNENWGQDFLDRYLAIAKIVRERHPEIKLVSTAGASPIGGDHDLAWKTLTCQTADMVDEHFYANPGWMMGLTHQFDGYDRSKPKVYAGEYACHVEDKANSLFSALCEAACMMGFERNCDVVEMSSYAPLFGKIGCEQWKPDLIWFDNLRAFTTPNYHVQKMFGNNLPSIYIPSAQSGEVADFHQVCGFDKATGEYVVKCVNLAADHALDLVVDFGAELPAGKIKIETLTGDPKVVNDMANPERCRPEAKSVVFAGGREFKTNLPASSLTIIRAKK
jgi:alpha-N-arabinofuranosidase